MAIPETLPQITSYDDLNRWARIERLLREHLVEKERHAVERRAESFEAHCEAVGYLRGLRWTLQMAADLDRPEPEGTDE